MNFENENLKTVRSELVRKLEKEWRRKSKSAEAVVIQKGEIARVSSPKPAGVDIWIKAKNGKQYYSFVKNDDVLYPHLIKGVKVSFQIKAIPDKPLDKAIRLKLDV